MSLKKKGKITLEKTLGIVKIFHFDFQAFLV